MPPAEQQPGFTQSSSARFATTHWTVVLAAREGNSPEAREALAELCSVYWYPLYAFIRRQGLDAHEAQDSTQEFFTRLLEPDFLLAVDRAKGRFRSFLLACCKHFLANERDRARARKRGGERLPVSLDFVAAEGCYVREKTQGISPEKLFERRWALTLLDQVLARLRDEFAAAGQTDYFDRLKAYLPGDRSAGTYEQFGAEFGMSEGAVKVAVHRLRRRYREFLREEIARTVGDGDQVEAEIRDLFAILG
jgi:RNA polymerase sigma factor (sigma-70 family)